MPFGRRASEARIHAAADIAAFCGLLAVLLYRAIAVADVNWDTLAYHLPFAARRIGLISEHAFAFRQWLEECYRGIPALPYYVYGALWRISGNANAPNAVSVLAYGAYCVLLARLFRAPLIVIAAAIAAIPVIHVNLGSAYTDILANLSLAAALIVAVATLIEEAPALLPRVLGAIACAALAANTKIQFVPLACVFAPLFVVALWLTRRNGQRLLEKTLRELWHARAWAVPLSVLLIVSTYFWPLRNLYLFGNPIFPVGISVVGHRLAGEMPQYTDPHYLRGAPQPVRWFLSISDVLSLGYRPLPYMLGQGDVPADAPSMRMGGYLGLFVFYNLAIFVMAAIAERRRILLACFAGLTLLVASLPASHELRYYSFWMLFLVSMNVALLWRWGGNPTGRRHFVAVAIAALVFVSAVTGLRNIYPGILARSYQHVMAGLRLDQIYAPRLQPGGRYCLVNWNSYAVLGSPLFYPNVSFSVVEAPTARECPNGTELMDLAALQAGSAQP